MQYDRQLFIRYYKEYLKDKEQLETNVKERIMLLSNEILKETVDFYDSLSNDQKKKFRKINCNNLFNRYMYNLIGTNEVNNNLYNLISKFYKSPAFPFSLTNFHFFVNDEGVLIDAITGEDSSELTDEENKFLMEVIKIETCYDPSFYNKDDIYMIKVLYDKYKNEDNKEFLIQDRLRTAKRIDQDITKGYKCSPNKDINHLRWKLSERARKIEERSVGRQKQLLLYEVDVASYELSLIEGIRVTDIYERLENEYKNGNLIKEVFDYQIDALINAYYHLTDAEFRKNSKYFSSLDLNQDFETANPKINQKILEMKTRDGGVGKWKRY